jgi:cellobiose-specific phosphotransferase system component IIC
MAIALGGLVSTLMSAVAVAITGAEPAGLLGIGAGSLSWAYLVLSAIGTAVVVTFTAPFQASLDSLLYVDLRMRKEQLAVDLQEAAAGVQQPPSQHFR